MLNKIFLIFFCFCAIYNTKLAFFPVNLGLLLWPLLGFNHLIRGRFRSSTNGNVLFPFICALGFLAYSTFVSAFIGEGMDFSIPYNFTIWIMLFLPEALVLSLSETGDRHMMSLCKIIVFAVAVQAFFIYVTFLSPGIRNVTSSLLGDTTGGILDQGGTRVKGLSAGGGASLSLIQGIGTAIAFRLFMQNFRFKYFFLTSFIFCSTLFTGRTGVIFSILFVTIYSLMIFIKGRIRFRVLIPSAIVISLLCYVAYIFYLGEDHKNLISEYVVKRSFDIFEVASAGDLKSHGAIEAIIDMYELPDSETGIFLGDGLWVINGVDYARDPGYIKNIFYWGIIGSLFFYLYFAFLMLKTILLSSQQTQKYFIAIIYILFFIMEFKEPFFAKCNLILHALYFSMLFDSKIPILKPQLCFNKYEKNECLI